MADMKLTDIERLMLANQFEILSVLNSDTSYAALAKQLRDGHEWLYSKNLHVSENLPREMAEHVVAILGLYGDLKSSYDSLEDKSGIDAGELIFPGFDGNNEFELLGFSQALSDAHKFEITVGKMARNSHSQTTEIYNRMIGRYRELAPKFPYSKEIIQSILDARTHPDNRRP